MSRPNVKEHMMQFLAGHKLARDPGDLDLWLEATAFIPEFHSVLVEEWHARNFSQDEADEVNGEQQQFLRVEIPSIARALAEMALEKVGVQDDD